MGDVIMFDSDEAAQPVTVQAWKASTGQICLDEHTARVVGSTHVACSQCGEPTRYATLCGSCSEKRALARYEAMPSAPWDGKQMVYSETRDEYYENPDDAEECLEYEGQNLASLRLVLCEPQHTPELTTDYFCDELPEDGEAPDEVLAAMDAFNAATKDIVLSWWPGKTRLSTEEPSDA
jgi:hypothetical protein